MANNRTLTAANCILLVSVATIFPTPQRLQGFAADNITDVDGVSPVEAQQGVDGRLSFGWAPTPKVQTITLMADSESNDFFETWFSAQQQLREVYIATGSLVIPSTGRKYAMVRGALTSYKPIPAIGRMLGSRAASITWQEVSPAPN